MEPTTVGELMEALGKCDPDSTVLLRTECGDYTILDVESSERHTVRIVGLEVGK